MSLEKLITEIASSHPVAVRAQRVTGITHRVGEAKQTAERAEDSARQANEDVLEAAQSAQQAGEDARQAGADVLETIRQIEAGELKTYIDLGAYISQGKLAGQITGVYIADLAVSRAKIADAAINSAKIANLAVNSQHVNELTASKITSGDITASLVNITGRLEAGGGGVRLDSMGLGLAPMTNTGSAPADSPGRKITNQGSSKWAALFPFDGAGVRGMSIRSDGLSGGANGRVELISTAFGDSSAASTGRIRVDAAGGGGAILMQDNVNISLDLGVGRLLSAANIGTTGRINSGERVYAAENVYAAGVVGPNSASGAYRTQFAIPVQTLGNNVERTFPHSFGFTPSWTEVMVKLESGNNWRRASHGSPSGFTWWANQNELVFRNTTGASIDIRGEIMQLRHT